MVKGKMECDWCINIWFKFILPLEDCYNLRMFIIAARGFQRRVQRDFRIRAGAGIQLKGFF